MELALEVADALVLVVEQALLLVALRPELLHLGPGTLALARRLHQHGGAALLRGHGGGGGDDGGDLGVDVEVEVALAGDVVVAGLDLLADPVAEVGADDGEADVGDPLDQTRRCHTS